MLMYYNISILLFESSSAEGAGFEPASPLKDPVFKTGGITIIRPFQKYVQTCVPGRS
jgi:hypothetical protein